MPALRTRFILSILVFVLVAAACGGGDDSAPSGSGDDTLPETFTTSDAGQEGSPEVSSEADATTTEGEQMDSAAPDSPSDDDPLDSTSDTEPQDSSQPGASSQPVVLLGDRFDWCSDVESVWTTYELTFANLWTFQADHEEALAAFESATDELDRAEARQALDELERSSTEPYGKHREALSEAVYQLRRARRASGDRPEDIAYQRAWSALLSADPEVAALSAALPAGAIVPTTTAAPLPGDDEGSILARVIGYREVYSGLGDSVWNRAAEEAAHDIYSQADSALIAEALQAAAPEAARAAHQLNTRQASDRSRAAYYVLLAQGGSVLAPFDADAYEAASVAASGRFSYLDHYLDSVQSTHTPLIPEDDDAFGSAYASRVRVIEAALPAALELAQATDALLEAEAEAERTRQREAEQALQAALEVLAEGSDAYTTFKRSFEESCQ